MIDIVTYKRSVEQLDKLLIQYTNFIAREATILVEDGGERPTLNLTQAADETSRAMFTLIAMY